MTDFITHFHFLRPYWLLALLPCVCVLALIWFRFKRSSQWDAVISAPLLKYLLDGQQIKRRQTPLLGAALLWIITCFSLAGPVWQQLPQPVQQNVEAMVIAWDLSPSMLAEDIKPSRLERARLKLIDLFKSRKDGLTALIAYSGEAYTVAPLTDDTNTLINLLPALTPTTLPSVGSNPEMALEQAIDLLKAANIQDGTIVILTDDIAEDAFPMLDSLSASAPYNIIYWGIGSVDGAPIPLPQGGFAKQADGNIVVAKLNENALRNFAATSGQFYIPVTVNDSDINAIDNLLFTGNAETIETDRLFNQWFEHGQYLALLLLPFIAFLFRRGWIFIFFCIPLLGLMPKSAEALSWEGLWLNQDQRAQAAMDAGDEGAPAQFSTPALQGSAYERLGQHEEAAKAFSQGDSLEYHYNQGTALTHAGSYEAAIEAFDKALAKKPNFENAIQNKAIAEQLLNLQKQAQQQQQKQDQNQESSEDNQSDQSESQESQSKQSDSEQSDSEKSQSQSQQNESEGSDAQQAQKSEDEQKGEQENPYSKAGEEEQQADTEEQSEEFADSQQEEEAKEAEQEALQQQAAIQQASAEQSEEEQKLQQWLRKVPDDPSGLLRNKFKHQYLERKRTFNQSQNEAEKRW